MYPLGTIISGKLLTLNPLFNTEQLHNYAVIFLIATIASFLSLIWACFMINEQKDRQKFYDKFSSDKNQNRLSIVSQISKQQNDDSVKNQNRLSIVSQSTKQKNGDSVKIDMVNHYKEYENVNPIKLLFDIKNVIEIVKTCTKKRTNYIRLQIWLLFLSMVTYFLSKDGSNVFLFQFVERVYQWDAEQYSYASSLNTLCHAIFLLTIIPFIIKVINN